MNPKVYALLSAVDAGAISALMVMQAGGASKLVAIAFAMQFLKDIKSLFTTMPAEGPVTPGAAPASPVGDQADASH